MAEKKTASEVASAQATMKASKKKPTKIAEVQPTSGNKTLTDSALKLIERNKVVSVELSTGLKFDIRAVQAADSFIGLGSLLMRRLTEEGVDIPTGDAFPEFVQEKIQSLTPVELIELEQTEENRVGKKAIICQGVIDVDFADMPQDDCPPGVVSIQLLSMVELNELWTHIMDLSIPERDVVTFPEDDSSDERKSDKQTTTA